MFKKITFFSLLLAVLVILLGTYIRLTGGLLACTDWPTCLGSFIVDKETINPDHLVQIWSVLGQRYLDGLLLLLSLVLGISVWIEKTRRLQKAVSSLTIIALLVLQAVANAWLVKLAAMPIITLTVMMLQMMALWLFYWQLLRSNPAITRSPVTTGPVMASRWAALVLIIQLILGGWLAVNHAGLACQGFPACNGQWWPDANYQSALDILYGLFNGYSGDLAFNAQVAINWLHRVWSLITFIALTSLVLRSMSTASSKAVRKAGLWLSGLLFLQIAVALLMTKLNLPIGLVIVHQLVGALLMLPLIAMSFYSRYGLSEQLVEPEVVALVKPDASIIAEEISQPQVEIVTEPEQQAESLYLRLKSQLKRTRSGLGGVLASLAIGQKEINRDLLEELETSLLTADIGIHVTTDIINQLTQSLERHQLNDAEALSNALKQALLDVLLPCNKPLQIPKQDKPFVILVVGVNGAGKTTTIGKLAKRLQQQGLSVMLAAGDTFRAAAVEQLQTWGERNNIAVVAQHTGADSASVIYDAVQSAQAKGVDVLIADTAGRLHTKSNLMDELKKVKRIISKLDDSAPHEVLLVLDAGTGQNALSQAKLFNETVALTGLVLTKLDGTAKGGVIFALSKQMGIPIRYIGIGEGIDDLQDFDAESFVNALFVKE